MTRAHTRNLIRQVAQACDPEAALLLYDRSIASGQKRIALLRYLDARDLSVPLTPQHHAYARAVASVLSERDIETIAREALRRSRERHASLALKRTG